MKTLYYTVNKTVASCYYSFPHWCIHLYRCGAVYEHTKIRAVATAQVLRVITSLVWAKWHLRVFVFLFWSGGCFLWGWGQGLSEVEFLLKQTLERQRAEIKQLHLEKASFTLLRYLQKGLQSVSVWYVCNVFTDSIMVFFTVLHS